MCLATVARISGNDTVQDGKGEKGQENVDMFDNKFLSLLILSDGSRK